MLLLVKQICTTILGSVCFHKIQMYFLELIQFINEIKSFDGYFSKKKRRIFSKKESFTLFCFSTLHSFIPNLSVGGVVAGTTLVTIHEEVVPSSEGIGGNCALSTDEIHTSSLMNVGKILPTFNALTDECSQLYLSLINFI